MRIVRASILSVGIVVALGCGGDETESPKTGTGSVMVNVPPGSGPKLGAGGSNANLTPPPISIPTQPMPPPANTTPPPPAGNSVPPPGMTQRPPSNTTPPPPTMTPPPPPAGMMPPPAVDNMPAPAGNMDPMIPPAGDPCPDFRNGTITYMSLGGIQMVAGAKAASPSAPMVFYWHGTGSFAGEFAGMAAAVQQGVVQEGGVLISFQGTTGGDFLSGTAIFGKGDFVLADGLLGCAVKNHNVDPRRVYATGCSAGGLFSTAMGAMRSSYMAAVAPNSGGSSGLLQWQNMHTPALMTVHGAPGRDVVGIDFSQSSATADMAYKNRKGFVINCNHGGGHCGGGGLAGDIWKFFKAHPFGVNPEPWTMLPAGFSDKCKIF